MLPEPVPVANGGDALWPMVISEWCSSFGKTAAQRPELTAISDRVLKLMADRDAFGRNKYGTPLQSNNGRKMLVDAFQEALDLVVYLRGAIAENTQEEYAFPLVSAYGDAMSMVWTLAAMEGING